MKIALIGYGKMGKMLEAIAIERGHQIVSRIDVENPNDFYSPEFSSADIALEFTTPAAVEQNIRKAWAAGVKVVSGTTGWHENLPILQRELEENGKTLFWASNFSIGVNIFFEINRQLAKIMNAFPQYDVKIEETHHKQKKDAPSGTAITLADNILSELNGKHSWTLSPEQNDFSIEITAKREGEVAGIHSTIYDSPEDIITLTHNAKSRAGFALGAILAAEFLQDKTGFFTMQNLLKINN
ncbi:MAG: 4-hydroxy-tetrahydrodipicolinate reductase [Prevotellaceae bacterium]|jgi:4-hydroxy-tetrahydrodipicolinate reductase|nr:4-hydroxy-tetrahydrodipicolinate reductase [Prevotellaceae bacterium]